LSQADASIGGKNGINFHGKNMIGTFYIPDLVVIDPVYIKSLSMEEVTNGIVEIIKHGLLGSETLLKFLRENRENIVNKEIDVIEKAILQSIKIKLSIISRDFREAGHRRILNLGHTIGHAIEELSHHTIPHGKAVAYGIRIAMRLGERLFGFKYTAKIEELFFDYGLPQDFPFKLDDLLDVMKQDKKNWYGKLVFAVPKEIGDIEMVSLEEEETRILLGDILENVSVNNV
jgi:3-dehydroquinate synthase